MSRIFAIVFATIFALPAWADLRGAVGAAGAREWSKAETLAQDIQSQAAKDVVEWMRLRGRQGNFEDCVSFLKRNPSWPGLPLLRARCETSIPRGSDAAPIIEFFAENLPRTGTGSLRLVAAFQKQGDDARARDEARRAWITHVMNDDEQAAFLDRHGDWLEDHHIRRLDMLLWDGERGAARRMLALVPPDYRKLAEARLALRAQSNGVDDLIAAVPEGLKDDPGLAYERFVWRAKKDLTDRAIELMLERSVSAESLGRPIEWAGRRRSMSRQLMRDGKVGLAYTLASQHQLQAGSAYADLEWLSGFLALRKLDAPQQALDHFLRFRAAVETPISLGRAGYWIGRAHEALGQEAEAAEAYGFGAIYQSSFYGQLAAERSGIPRDPAMLANESFPDWQEADFASSTVFEAGLALQRAGVLDLAERFWVHLAESLSRSEIGSLANFALSLKEPHIALMLAKQAARQGHEIYAPYFPVMRPEGAYSKLPAEWGLAIARRESEFDPSVISPVGARGLMQLMPGTAREMSGVIGEGYSASRLLSDPNYNARLGMAYLEELDARFKGNPVLMAIGYNAGPARAERWPTLYGDPRRSEIVDWIEGIPFRETRNYVMRVTESFAPYRAQLTGQLDDQSLLRLLKQ